MRIALLTAEYPPQIGGVGDYTHCLAHALAAQGHAVAVVTGTLPSPSAPLAPVWERGWRVSDGGEGEVQPPPSAPLAPVWERGWRVSDGGEGEEQPYYLPGINSWGWRCWRDTIAALALLRPDILHIQYQTGAYAMHPAINLLPWRLRGLPHRPHIVVTFHDLLEPYLFPKAGPLRRWITVRLARDADGVIVTNAEDAARLPRTPAIIPIGSNIAQAPPPGYQRAAWRNQIGVQPGELLVAYFGLLSRSKGVDVLLDALKRAQQAGLPVRLLLIGGAAPAPHDRAYAAEVANQIERLELHDTLIRTGHVDTATVSAHLLTADCVVLPFRSGASFRSGSLLAALTHGVPVITTTPADSRTLPRLVHGEHVWLVPPEDRNALAAALQQFASDAALRAHLGRGAQQLGAQFAWSTIAQQHGAFYGALNLH